MQLVLKTKKYIVTFFNLLLFISSFLFTSFNGFSSKTLVASVDYKQQLVNENSGGNSCAQLMFEEIGSETEHGIQERSTLLPFSIDFIDFEIQKLSIVSEHILVQNLHKPIYLSVCNFRI